MSVRKRAVTNRLVRELQLEREVNLKTRGELEAAHELLRKKINELDVMRSKCDVFRHVAIEMAQYFTDPPSQLSRDSELFRLLQQVVPRHIPPMRTTPQELLRATLGMAGADLETLVKWAAQDSTVAQ